MSNLEKQSEDGEMQMQTSPDSYSDEFNLDKGVDRTYEYKCNLGMLHVLEIFLTFVDFGVTSWLVNRCLQEE